MLPWLAGRWGNPSSVHAMGRAAREALENAREQVAGLVAAHPSQVIFTSGGTEANNTAIKGFALRNPSARLAGSAVEHASVQQALKSLQRNGWPVDSIPANSLGQVTADAVEASLRQGARLVSVMWANNETGVINDIAGIATHVREAGAVFHTDAVQAAGKLDVDFVASGTHLMSLSAHKLNGPKGIGALIRDKSVDMEPLLHGGGQEKEQRGGTENLAAIVGFGCAAELAVNDREQHRQQMLALRKEFEQVLASELPQVVVFAREAERLPNTTFLALPGIEGETLLLELDRQGLGVSSGAACGSGYSEPSHVLHAMGIDADLARCAVRVSFGAGNSRTDIDRLLGVLRQQAMQQPAMAAGAW